VEKPLLHKDRVDFLEKRIKSINKQLLPLEEFIIPGGSETGARLHVARSICRRAELDLVSLNNTEKLSTDILKYVNRLSDYLFVLARLVIDISGGKETQWDRRD
jgi:cob(I)alamin adenosyltransferase